MKNRVVIWGASGHAKVVADILDLLGQWEIVGLIEDFGQGDPNGGFNGFRILGGREQLIDLKHKGVTHVILGFGDCKARLVLSQLVKASGLQLATAVHPSAVVARDVKVGAGTVIAAGAVVAPASCVGENVIINTCASVDHECSLGDGVHLGPGARLGGQVVVGEGTWVGIGATVRDHIRIGEGSIIGAGALVLKDVPSNEVWYGVPSRFARSVVDQMSAMKTDSDWLRHAASPCIEESAVGPPGQETSPPGETGVSEGVQATGYLH